MATPNIFNDLIENMYQNLLRSSGLSGKNKALEASTNKSAEAGLKLIAI